MVGWRRRSKSILDNEGAPRWLIDLRCPSPPPDWGHALNYFMSSIDPGFPWDEEDDPDE